MFKMKIKLLPTLQDGLGEIMQAKYLFSAVPGESSVLSDTAVQRMPRE